MSTINHGTQLLDLIRDDAYAASFQSLGQYRKALMKVAEDADTPAEQPAPDAAAHLVEALFQQYEANPHLTVGRWIEHGPFAELFASCRSQRGGA